jgi:hypothetical protein
MKNKILLALEHDGFQLAAELAKLLVDMPTVLKDPPFRVRENT